MRPIATRSTLLLLCLGAFLPTTSAFRIYDGIESSLMQAYYGVSDQCLKALNSTLNCNKGIASKAASGPDNYFWARQNVTALCTQECSNSMASWLAAVEKKCDGETVPSSHLTLLAKSIPTLWKEGYDLVCLQDTESNWCLVESQDWQGSDYIRWDPWACDSDGDDDQTDIPPECDDPDFSVDQISPDMKDVTKLYDSDLLCSDCFIKLWRQRLMSSLLPNSEHTDYLLEQYEAMQKYCNKKLPVTLYETNLLVPTQTTPRPTATATPLPPTIDTCSGQLIEASDGDIGCVYLADKYNVSTGHLVHITNDMSCEFDSPICVPLPCEIDIVYHTPTCEELAAKYSTNDFTVSRTQLLTWNLYILGSCGYLNDVQRVCKRPPGGHYKASGVISSPTTAGEYFTTATPAEPTRTGTTESCGRYYKIVSGDTCNSVALRFGITFRELKSLNTYLWDNCTNLWSDYDVCVASVSQPPLSKDGTCGPSNDNAICDGTTFGRCCSTSGYCGKGSDYCGSGNCISGACEPAGSATTNGTCGPDWGFRTCTNPSFGPCCSIYGYCGDGNDFCGASHCYSGKCDDDNGGPSINGECGPSFAGNKTCTGTQFGKCCSTSGYCGSTDEYCGEGNCYSGACE